MVLPAWLVAQLSGERDGGQSGAPQLYRGILTRVLGGGGGACQ